MLFVLLLLMFLLVLVIANADTHDTVGTDVAHVIAHAAIVAMLLIPVHIAVIHIGSDVVLAILLLMICITFLIFLLILMIFLVLMLLT